MRSWDEIEIDSELGIPSAPYGIFKIINCKSYPCKGGHVPWLGSNQNAIQVIITWRISNNTWVHDALQGLQRFNCSVLNNISFHFNCSPALGKLYNLLTFRYNLRGKTDVSDQMTALKLSFSEETYFEQESLEPNIYFQNYLHAGKSLGPKRNNRRYDILCLAAVFIFLECLCLQNFKFIVVNAFH